MERKYDFRAGLIFFVLFLDAPAEAAAAGDAAPAEEAKPAAPEEESEDDAMDEIGEFFVLFCLLFLSFGWICSNFELCRLVRISVCRNKILDYKVTQK